MVFNFHETNVLGWIWKGVSECEEKVWEKVKDMIGKLVKWKNEKRG